MNLLIKEAKKLFKTFSWNQKFHVLLGLVLFSNLFFPVPFQAQQASNLLQIVSPINGTIVSPGTTLNVEVSLTPGTNFIKVALIGENLPIQALRPGASSIASFSLDIPNSMVGPEQLTASGLDASGHFAFSQSITIDVEPSLFSKDKGVAPPLVLNQLDVSPKFLPLDYAGEQIPLNVEGTFSDGTRLNLTHSSLITYISNALTVATVDTRGYVTGVGPGTADLEVIGGGQSVSVTVTVPRTIPGDLDGDGDVDQDDLNVILTYLNWPATGPFDARDLNHDGKIDLLDAQALTALCTKPCAIPAAKTDTIPPTTSISSSPMPNANGWNNTDVTISLSAVDNPGGSGVKAIYYQIGSSPKVTVAGSRAMVTLTSEGVYTIQYYAADNAGNMEAVHTLSVKIDKTPPTLTFGAASPPPNTAGWNNTNVSIPFTTADNLSGVAGTSVASPLILSSEGTAVTGTVTVTDLAGNSATFFTVPVKIDKTPPVLTMPALATSYILNSTVSFSFGATDALSGVADSQGTLNGNPVSSGSTVTLGKIGVNTFNLTATDVAGNRATQSATFSVLYRFGGFLPPLAPNNQDLFNVGRTIPVKFQLTDATGAYVSTAISTLTLQLISEGVPAGVPMDATSSGNANTANFFRYDSTSNQYIYNLNTLRLSSGTWQIQVHLDDGTVHTVVIGMK